MPEEHNRVLADHLADLCCAPTDVNLQNLLREGIPADRIRITGNTVVEAVESMLPGQSARRAVLERLDLEAAGFILATFHRPENVDQPENLLMVLRALEGLPLPVVLPIHPRTRKRLVDLGLSEVGDGLHIIEPLPYERFLALEAEAALIVSDSGGVQEEASIVKRPVIVVRRSTERPEVLGTFAHLIWPGSRITEEAARILADRERVHGDLAGLQSPYGDGSASDASVAALTALLSR
jgi:UDP-N-acetylglucosamine 2-epimerase (non-hydrolysing)